MLFQGQELLEDRWFDDTVALDWDEGAVEQRASSGSTATRSRSGVRVDGSTRGLRGTGSADPARRQRGRSCSRCTAGTRAVRTTTRWSWRTSRTGRATTCGSGSRRPAAGGSASTRDSAAYDLGFGGHEAFDTDADGEPMDGCDQSGLVSVGPYSVVVLSRED